VFRYGWTPPAEIIGAFEHPEHRWIDATEQDPFPGDTLEPTWLGTWGIYVVFGSADRESCLFRFVTTTHINSCWSVCAFRSPITAHSAAVRDECCGSDHRRRARTNLSSYNVDIALSRRISSPDTRTGVVTNHNTRRGDAAALPSH